MQEDTSTGVEVIENESAPKETGLAKLSPFETTKLELEKFVEDYRSLVVTQATYEASKKARQAIRAKRFEIQGIEKSNNDQLNALKKQNKSNAEELIAVLTEVENRIHADIEVIEAAKEKEKQDKLAAIEQKYNNRIAELLKTGCEFSGITYVLGTNQIGASAVRTLSDLDFSEVLETFKSEAATTQINANRYAAMTQAGMIGTEKEFSYPADLFPNNSNIIYVSAINACTDSEFDKLLTSVVNEIHNEKEKVEAIKKEAAELKARTEERIKHLASLGCLYTGTSYEYSCKEMVSQADVQGLDAASWLIRSMEIEEEVNAVKKAAAVRLERNKELRPFIMFIRDFNAMLDMPEAEYQQELADIKEGANQHYANEQKKEAEAARLAEENKSLLEARTKSRTALLFGLGLSLSGDKYSFHNIEVTAKQAEQLLETEWIETLAIVTDKVAVKKKQIEDAAIAEKVESDKRAEAEAARLEALKPEKEKLAAFLRELQQVSRPELTTKEASVLLDEVIGCINKYSEKIIALK